MLLMYAYLYNLIFGQKDNATSFQTQKNATLIYNFLDHKDEYIAKCTPKISTMKSLGLLNDLQKPTCENIIAKYDRDFWDLDIEHVQYFSPLLSLILNNELIALTDYNTKMMSKMVCKKYIIEPKPTGAKVSCAIYVGAEKDNTKLQVNCYDIDKKGIYYFNDPKGSVQIDECIGAALKRELFEELNLTFNDDRYSIVSQDNKWTRFKVVMTQDEYHNYVKTLDTSKIDVEITHIALVKYE